MYQDDEKIILFGPRNGKSIAKLYPEIGNDPRFKGISSDDLFFAWLIGIPNSPCDENWPITARWSSAATKAIKDRDRRNEFALGNYPEEIKVVIKAFSGFNPEARLAAQKIQQTIFNNMIDAVKVPKDGFLKTKTIGSGKAQEVVTEIDASAQKSHMDMSITISKALPEMVKGLEDGFGVTIQEKQKTEEGFGNRSIDKYHTNKKDQAS